MMTAPLLTLLVLPAVYLLVHRTAEARARQEHAGTLPGQVLAAGGGDRS
jgi:hypothetical protein